MHKKSTPTKIGFATLGCRLNQFETDALIGLFTKNDYKIVDFDEKADVYVINSCTITGKGEQKSRNKINRAIKKNGSALIVVTGCSVVANPDYFRNRNDIDIVVTNKKKHHILQLVEEKLKGLTIDHPEFDDDSFSLTTDKTSSRTRAAVKIQDGCDNFCSYCIVPLVRGRAISRKYDEIIKDIKRLVSLDYKEIVLTGVNIAVYKDNDINFTALIKKILDIPLDFRLRLSSVEPIKFDDAFIQLFNSKKLCNHLHLCLQSGSNKILQEMNRNYNREEFGQILTKMKKVHPLFNFTTDIITGFPGETETDFQDSINAVKDMGFTHVHTFKYSIRNKTKAAKSAEQIPEKDKKERSKLISLEAEKNKKKFRKSLIGKKQKVLVEKIGTNRQASGYGELYVPVKFKTDSEQTNIFKTVNIIGINKDLILLGEL